MTGLTTIEQRAHGLIAPFSHFKDWEDKYKLIIQLGKEMPAMPVEFKTEQNKVKGCQSQVWLHAHLDKGRMILFADSDASIVKGLIAVLLKVYSESTPDEVLTFKPTFIDELGLRQHLSMSRANGLNAMLKQISFYALAFRHQLSLQQGARG